MRFSIFMIVLILVSCNKPKEADDLPKKPIVFRVVPDINHSVTDEKGNFIEMRSDYYSDKNFIIDETGRIFFYGRRKYRQWVCGTRDDKEDSSVPKPEFINLHPAEIIEIPENSIEDFIKLNTSNDNQELSLPMIASARDTFESPALDRLLTQIYHHKKTIHVIRRMTEEEKVVMRYKRSKEIYFPDRIEWDTTKIVFPEQD